MLRDTSKKFRNQSNNIIQYIILYTNQVNLQLFWMVKVKMQFLKIEFLKLSPKLCKNTKSFLEKMEFFPMDPRCALQTFPRQSSEYLQHSVLSPKRFGQKEMKIEQKARPLPKKIPHFGGVRGGTSTDLREVCARRIQTFDFI